MNLERELSIFAQKNDAMKEYRRGLSNMIYRDPYADEYRKSVVREANEKEETETETKSDSTNHKELPYREPSQKLT